MKQKTLVSKRTLLLGVLVVVLGMAVYLNWYLSKNPVDSSVTDTLSGGAMGQAVYVNADAPAESQQETDYFSKTRTERKTARDEALAALEKIINNVKSDKTEVAEATKKSVRIAEDVAVESNMESLIKAKGFSDCVVIIGESDVSVIVKTQGLLAGETVQIQEIAEKESGFSLQNIKIIEVK